jgi:hypothetical protein
MNKILETLKSRNRTLLEWRSGILICGLLMWGIGSIFASEKWRYAAGLWLGILAAFVCTWHMYRSLDRALDFDESTAQKRIYSSYLVRYFTLAVFLALVCLTDLADPIPVFLGILTLKLGAYLQPFLHKFFNKLFHETDPVPVTEEEAMARRAAMDELSAEGGEVSLKS